MVALETRLGLLGLAECDVDGRDSRRPRLGRGGSGGGVPSLDGADACERPDVEVFLDKLRITLIVGFAKSCCTTWSSFLGDGKLPSGDGASGCDASAERVPVMSPRSSGGLETAGAS